MEEENLEETASLEEGDASLDELAEKEDGLGLIEDTFDDIDEL
ncbi:MAG: hypothetical protein Q8P86_02575 [bacterium]|nr:hypothetical protein [bacterium]